jgi:hypothetical protein
MSARFPATWPTTCQMDRFLACIIDHLSDRSFVPLVMACQTAQVAYLRDRSSDRSFLPVAGDLPDGPPDGLLVGSLVRSLDGLLVGLLVGLLDGSPNALIVGLLVPFARQRLHSAFRSLDCWSDNMTDC